ncbi:MAG: cadmium-translocating P-type ATPase [Phormidium sp. OSCR]|nr:MAG: cadmium-translocating P-type ATPase [Phormidium sp. OSCR]
MSTSSGCGCHETVSPSQEQVDRFPWREFGLLGVAIAWFGVGLVLSVRELLPLWGEWLWFIPAYLWVGWGVLTTAGQRVLKGKALDENFLMAIATIGAIAIGELPEALAVMLFYRLGEAIQDLAVDRSRDSIRALLAIRPDLANLKTAAGFEPVPPESVAVGAEILVKPGERVPLDGKVLSGESYLDTSALTGESVPRSVQPGEEVLAGSINQTGALTVRITRPFGESSLVRILELVEQARQQKAPTEKFISRFARRYTPIVVALAVAIALIPPLFGGSLTQWGYRALVLLVISCPCSLVVSIPLGYFGGIGGAAKQGILLKGSVFLDRLTDVSTVVFDKTGTLTEGSFEVTQVQANPPWDEDTLLHYSAIAESQSTHPIAQSIGRAWTGPLDSHRLQTVQEYPGRGVRATLTNSKVCDIYIGNERLFQELGLAPLPKSPNPGTRVRVAFDGQDAGTLEVSDRLRDDAPQAIQALRDRGIQRIVMLTGDSQQVGQAVGDRLGLDEVYSELLPEDKATLLEKWLREPRRPGAVIFVGDGINDAPALALADVGVAMGGLGSDAAIETADVVLMEDSPAKLVQAIAISHRTRAIVWQNIILSLAVKLLVIILGTLGLAGLWEAIIADVGVALVAVANATRAAKG